MVSIGVSAAYAESSNTKMRSCCFVAISGDKSYAVRKVVRHGLLGVVSHEARSHYLR